MNIEVDDTLEFAKPFCQYGPEYRRNVADRRNMILSMLNRGFKKDSRAIQYECWQLWNAVNFENAINMEREQANEL